MVQVYHHLHQRRRTHPHTTVWQLLEPVCGLVRSRADTPMTLLLNH